MKSWLIEEQKLFSQQVINNTLPHAILISGVNGSGKTELANWLIRIIQCTNLVKGEVLQPCNQCKHCRLLLKEHYPDHYTVTPEKNLLGVDSIRKITAFFEKKAQIGTVKSILIPEANQMTVAAANALLKTLEEPTNNSVIILLSNERDALLPTIISRCRLFDIRPPSGTLLAQQSDAVTHQYNAYTNLSHLPELSSHETSEEYQIFEQSFLKYLSRAESKLVFMRFMVKTSHSLRWLEKIIANLMRNNQGWINEEGSSTALSNETLWRIYTTILTVINQSKSLSQINHQFMIEKLLIDIDNILITDEL